HILTMRAWLAFPMHRIPARGDIVLFELPERPGQAGQDANAGTRPGEGQPSQEVGGRKTIGVFRTKGDILIKRVIGLPGETIQVKEGHVLINDSPITESYSLTPSDPDSEETYRYAGYEPLHLGPNEIFVLGDNRSNSDDSRYIGPIQQKQIIGKYLRVLWHSS